jgi:hypothetical protein
MSKAAELAALIGSQTALSNRNLIINGAMQVAQRGTSAVTITSTGEYPNIDRYSAGGNDSSLISVEQSTDAPSGFEYSLKVTSLAASTTDAADYQFIGQRIEGYNTAQLDWGASGAKTVTASFYVKCSVTGNIPFVIVNSNDTRVYAANCTVSSANTWEYKTITIDGDTSGTWLKTNGIGLKIQWYMALGSNFQGTLDQWGTDYGASGQINVCNTNGATFQVTGVQLEVGEQATPFEHRSFGDELARCQRYYEKSFPQATAPANNTSLYSVQYTNVQSGYGTWHNYNFAVPKRAAPTMTAYNPSSTTANKAVHVANNVAFTNTTLYAQGEYGFVSAIYGGTEDATGNKVGFNWDADAEL